jgi:hypothetical protein
MRKTIFKHVFLLFLLAGIVYACMDDEVFSPRTSLSPEVSAAQKWYESQVPKGWIPWKSASGTQTNTYKPDWQKAFYEENDEWKVTEVHLVGEERLVFASSDCVEKYEETKDERYKVSDIRLLIRTNKETEETDGFIMIVYPDLQYAEMNLNHPLKGFSYLKKNDIDFGGMIHYHTMDGEYLNGWKYTEGLAYAVLREESFEDDSENALRASKTCDYVCVWTDHYRDWYNGNTWEYQWTEWMGSSEECYYTNCKDDPAGSGEPGGGSSSGNGPGNNGNDKKDKQPEARDDCPEKAAQNSNKVNNALNSTTVAGDARVKTWVKHFRNYAKDRTNEYSMVINKSGNGYAVLNQNDHKDKQVQDDNPIYFREGNNDGVSGGGITDETYMVVHTHPEATAEKKAQGKTNLTAPSSADVSNFAYGYYYVQGTNSDGTKSLESSVTIGYDGSEYMIHVDNPTRFGNFCGTNSDFLGGNGSFPAKSKLASDYEIAKKHLENQGYSANDAHAYALSYTLDANNSGLKIYKKEPGADDFKEKRTDMRIDARDGVQFTATICK